MNNITGETPFFRLLVPVVLGIVANEFIEFLPSAVFFSSIGFLAMLLSFFIPKNNEFRYRWIFGAGVFVFIFSLITFQYKRKTEDSSFGSVVPQGIYKGVVHDIPQEKPRSVRVNTNLMYPVRKKVILYLEKDAESNVLRPGDEILFQAKMQPFKNLGNPDDFDYVRFMKIKGFAGSAYVPAHRWMKTGKSIRSVYTLSQNLRAKALDFYKSFGLNPDEYAFIAALTLGYKSNLSNDLQEAFRASGTAHVLAVSGLHVGIIYLILNMFFSFLGNSGKKFVLKQLLIVLFLWGYAFIAGLPVSVVRAAIMLSIFCLGKAFHREGFSYNSLAAAAFFILVFDPMNLFDVGFQMSFLSVFAILFFKPKLDTLYTPSRRSFLKIRDLFTLSLSAQLGVFPLVLYYFGTFPTYFFVTNLLIVPLIGMAIYAVIPVVFLGILNQLNLAVFHSLFRAMSWTLNKLIGLIIHIVYVFESLPCSRITKPSVSPFVDLYFCKSSFER
jgi:competence protein ComEC